jgi:hypothetical protein
MWLLAVVRVVLALLSLFGARWAYVAGGGDGLKERSLE